MATVPQQNHPNAKQFGYFRTELQHHRNEWLARWITAQQTTTESLVFHYTTPLGLVGILKSGTFWATNVLYLNDSSELAYGLRLIEDCLRTAKEKLESPPQKLLLEGLIDGLNPFQSLDVYVACFCKKGDLLSQWRGYGNTGAGYAVGIGSSVSQEASEEKEPPIYFRKVIYNRDKGPASIVLRN